MPLIYFLILWKPILYCLFLFFFFFFFWISLLCFRFSNRFTITSMSVHFNVFPVLLQLDKCTYYALFHLLTLSQTCVHKYSIRENMKQQISKWKMQSLISFFKDLSLNLAISWDSSSYSMSRMEPLFPSGQQLVWVQSFLSPKLVAVLKLKKSVSSTI